MEDVNEWVEMINQEIKELQRLLDRKAEQKQIAKFQAVYTKDKRVTFQKKLKPEDLNILEESALFLSKDDQTIGNDFGKRNPSTQSTDQKQKVHKFGDDISSDFTTLFSAFNRVAKQKLDHAILTDFYSVALVDSNYQKRSIQFSAQVTESCQLFYQLFDEKITNLSQRIEYFHSTVTQRLNEIDFVTKSLQLRLKRLYTNRRRIANKNNDSDDETESKSSTRTKMSARISGRLSSRLPDGATKRTINYPQKSFAAMGSSDFSHTAQPIKTTLYNTNLDSKSFEENDS